MGTTSFNCDISKWDVSNVQYMMGMFMKAPAFNGDISKWDVSTVTDMSGMFYDASAFNRELCGAAWVHSTATKSVMFEGSPGSISQTACTSAPTTHATTMVTRQYESRRPIPERDLLVRTPIARPVSMPASTSSIGNMMECAKCGTFPKSGRISCCAPGGAWYRSCGGAGSGNVDHSWFEGVQACNRKFKAKKACSYMLLC